MRRRPVRSPRRGADPSAPPAPAQRRSSWPSRCSAARAVAMTVQAAERTRAAWGAPIPVLVATDDLAAGDRLDAGQHEGRRARPEPLVPDGALTSLPDRRSGRGRDVRRRGGPGGAAGARPAPRPWPPACPPGTRAMAIPVEPGTTPPLVVGDRVDVLVALAPEAAGGGPAGLRARHRRARGRRHRRRRHDRGRRRRRAAAGGRLRCRAPSPSRSAVSATSADGVERPARATPRPTR